MLWLKLMALKVNLSIVLVQALLLPLLLPRLDYELAFMIMCLRHPLTNMR
jgi:hypothetical protein